jgi:hypothetical protein
MFETLVADALNKYLGAYVELDPERVRASVWNGYLELGDLRLKDSAFATSLGVPAELAGGHVGLVRLEIPWSRLGKAPVKVHIDSVLACVRLLDQPQTAAAAGKREEGAAAAAHFFKRAALAADEAAWKAAADISGGAPPNSLFVQKIFDNVEVHLTNVHIRVEDPVSCPSSPWAIGLTLDSISIHSTNSNWVEQFIETPTQLLHKVVQLGGASPWASHWCAWAAAGEPGLGVSVYMQACGPAVAAWPPEECDGSAAWQQHMREMVHPTAAVAADMLYILRPVSGAVRATIDQHNGRGDTATLHPSVYELTRPVPFSEPVLEAWLRIEEVELVLEHQTVQRFARLGTWVARMNREPAPTRGGPGSSKFGAQRTVAWWRWAYACVRQPRTDWSWDTLQHACACRRSYAGYSSVSQLSHCLGDTDGDSCDDQDDDGFHTADEDESVQDEASLPEAEARRTKLARINQLAGAGAVQRSAARHYGLYERQAGAAKHSWLTPLSDQETGALRRVEDELPVAVIQVWRRQALQRLHDEATARVAAEPQSWWRRQQAYLGLSKKQTEFLRAEIGDWQDNTVTSYPLEFIQQRLCLDVDTIRVSLRQQGRYAGKENFGAIAELQLGTTSIRCTKSEASLTTDVKLRSVKIFDQGSLHTQFETVVDKDEARCQEIYRGQVRMRATAASTTVEIVPESEQDTNWLYCVVEQNRRNPAFRVRLEIAPLMVVFCPHLVETLLHFAQLRNDLELSVAIAAMHAMVQQAVAFVNQTDADAIATAMAAAPLEPVRQVMELDVTLHAPTILIPDDCSKATASCVRLCLGDFRLMTGASSETQDIFTVDVTNLQVDLVEVQSSTGLSSNCRQLLSRSATSMATIKKKASTCTDSSVASLGIDVAVSPFTAILSDGLLVSLSDVVSSVASQRAAVLAELAAQSACQGEVAAVRVVEKSSAELTGSVEFEGIHLSLTKGVDELAVLQMGMLKVTAAQNHGGALTVYVSVRTLVVIDQCSSSKDQMPRIVSTDSSRMPSSQVGAELLNVTMEKDDSKLTLYVVLQPLKMIYNPHLVERLLDIGQYMSQLRQSAALLKTTRGQADADAIATAMAAAPIEPVRQVMELDVILHAPTILIPDDCSKATASCVRLCLDEVKLRVLHMVSDGFSTAESTVVPGVYRTEVTRLQLDLCDVQSGTNAASNITQFLTVPLVFAEISKPVVTQALAESPITLQLRSLDDPISIYLSNRLCEVLTGIRYTMQDAASTQSTGSSNANSPGGRVTQLKVEIDSSILLMCSDMARADASPAPFCPAQRYMLRGEVMRLYLKELNAEGTVLVADDQIGGNVQLGSLRSPCSIAVSDTRLKNDIRHLAGTNMEFSQVALNIGFMVPRASQPTTMPVLKIAATIGEIKGSTNDIFLINAMAILSNLMVWQARAFGGGDHESWVDLRQCRIVGTPEHAHKIHVAVNFARKTAWTWHESGTTARHGKIIALEKYIEPGSRHRSRGWVLEPMMIPPRAYSADTLQEAFVAVITENAMRDSWTLLSEQLLPRLLDGEIRIGRRDWNFAAAGFEAGALPAAQVQLNREKASKQAQEFVYLCSAHCPLVEWEAWLHSLTADEIAPGYHFGDVSTAVLGSVIDATGAALDSVLDAGAALADGRPLAAASSVVGGGIDFARATVGGAAQASESVLGGVVHGMGDVVHGAHVVAGELFGSGEGEEEAKWIWADAGKVGWVGLEMKHRLARETYSFWTRGTFAVIEANLLRKRGADAARGVELQFTNRAGSTVDMSFATPLQCANWIQAQRNRYMSRHETL